MVERFVELHNISNVIHVQIQFYVIKIRAVSVGKGDRRRGLASVSQPGEGTSEILGSVHKFDGKHFTIQFGSLCTKSVFV